MHINVVNPQAEKVTITIYDNNKSAVYKKNVGTEALYRGKFDMSDAGRWRIYSNGKKR
jgi:hypothetical protein